MHLLVNLNFGASVESDVGLLKELLIIMDGLFSNTIEHLLKF